MTPPLRYTVLIPARNEAEALPTLFETLADASGSAATGSAVTILVVDNGSTDGTAEVARAHGARVVEEPRPGYGRACLAGIRAIAAGEPPEALVFLDADDFLAPAQLARLLDPIRSDEADLVIGERASSTDRGVRWHARLGNRLVLAAMRAAYGSRVGDMGPFRAIRWSALEALALDDETYGWYVQMQVRALRDGYRVIGVPVAFERRTVGRSKVSGDLAASVRAGVVMLGTLAVEILRPGRKGAGERRAGAVSGRGVEREGQPRADASS